MEGLKLVYILISCSSAIATDVGVWGRWEQCSGSESCPSGGKFRSKQLLPEGAPVLKSMCSHPPPPVLQGDLTLRNCQNSGTFSSFFGTLEALRIGTQFCSAISSSLVDDNTRYSLTVMINNMGSYGHPGIALNVLDWQNFDYVYYRVHTGCFVQGQVIGGNTYYDSPDPIACGTVANREMFEMKGEVKGKTVTVYADGRLVYSKRLVLNGRGAGVVVHNGYDNTLIYRRFNLENIG